MEKVYLCPKQNRATLERCKDGCSCKPLATDLPESILSHQCVKLYEKLDLLLETVPENDPNVLDIVGTYKELKSRMIKEDTPA